MHFGIIQSALNKTHFAQNTEISTAF